MFITFEGLDLSGKSTQAVRFVRNLSSSGYAAELVRDPGGTDLGEKIRTILLDNSHHTMNERTELFLFSASRAQLVHELIKPALDAGRTVVCDRFYDSTTAYQGGGRGISFDEIRVINACATGGIQPALTFLLDVPIDEIEKRRRERGGKDRMEAGNREFFERVRQAYLDIAHGEPRFRVLDGRLSVEELERQIWESFTEMKGGAK